MGSAYVAVEAAIRSGVQWLRLIVELIGAGVIAIGIALGVYVFIRASLHSGRDAFTDARLTLARYLVLALEFQVAADILSTAIAPSWEQIGKLGAIVVIRTILNFFLTREVAQEEARARDAGRSDAPPEDPGPAKTAGGVA